MNLGHHLNDVGHALHIMGTIVDTAFYVNGLQIFAKYE